MIVPFVSSNLLNSIDGVRHGFTGRGGGVSDGVFSSLNLSPFSGDEAAKVETNRSRVRSALGVNTMVNNHQVHGYEVRVIDGNSDLDVIADADGMVTKERGVAIAALGADCAPVLFADAENGVIGVAHVGWRGAVAGITDAVVDEMLRLGSRLTKIRCAIGPAIALDSYEVGAEFRQQVTARSKIDVAPFFLIPEGADNWHFNLPGYISARLSCEGVRYVDCLGLDTYADEQQFFSYRRCCHRQEVDYGRQAGIIVLDLQN